MANTCRPDQSAKLARLELKRRRLDVTLEELAGRAGIRLRKVYWIRAKGRALPGDLRRLTFALRAIEKERSVEREAFGVAGSTLEAAARIAFQALLATVRGKLPEEHERKGALYLLVTGANVPGATAGRVFGCTKQYVSKAVRQVEDLREDPEIGAVFSDIEASLFPGGDD